MRMIRLLALLAGVWLALVGCAGPTPARTSTPVVATPDPAAAYRLASTCGLLDSRDLASLFPSAEVTRGARTADTVDRPIFAAEDVPAREASCIYYAFYQPGSKSGEMIQVTTWLDVPAGSDPGPLAAAWSRARESAGAAVADLGEAAYYAGGRLMVRQGSVYLTVEATGGSLDNGSGTPTGQQLDVEQKLARDALGRLG